MNSKTRLFAAGLGLWLGCATPEETTPPPPEEGEVVYEGDTTGGIPFFIPGRPDAGEPIDGGPVEEVGGCCTQRFALAMDGEPEHTVGRVIGNVDPLTHGLPLARNDGGWEATACVNVNASGFYWYEFEWAGSADAGDELLGDGGAVARKIRYDDAGAHFAYSDGTERNFIRAVSACSER